MTGADGLFSFEVGYAHAVTLTATSEGYISRTAVLEPETFTAEDYEADITLNEIIYRDVKVVLKDIVGDPVTGAVVKVGEAPAAEAEGVYTFAEKQIGDYTVEISAEGFFGGTVAISQDEFDYETDTPIEKELVLVRSYAEVGTLNSFDEKDWTLAVTRDGEGIYLKIEADALYDTSFKSVAVTIWFSVGETSAGRTPNMYNIDFALNALHGVANYTRQGGGKLAAGALDAVRNSANTRGWAQENGKTVGIFYVPYSTLLVQEREDAPVTKEDVIGILFDKVNKDANTEAFLTFGGIPGNKNSSTTYVRLGSKNELFAHTKNEMPVAIKYTKVGTLTNAYDNADWTFSVSRDEEGVYLKFDLAADYTFDSKLKRSITIWFSVGETAATRTANMYNFDFNFQESANVNGVANMTRQGGGVLAAGALNTVRTHEKTEGWVHGENSMTGVFFIPYSVLQVTERDNAPITKDDVFGVLFSKVFTEPEGTQTESYLTFDGIAGSKSGTTTFVRVDADCNVYSGTTNTPKEG